MDPTLNTSPSGFLGGLGDIALSYLATRANIDLQNQSGGQVPVNYLATANNPAPSSSVTSSTFLHSPILWVAVGSLLFVAVIMVAGKKK